MDSENSIPDRKGNYNFKNLDCYKEFDFLLLSKSSLGVKEAKKILNGDYLINMKNEEGKMLAMVCAKRKKD